MGPPLPTTRGSSKAPPELAPPLAASRRLHPALGDTWHGALLTSLGGTWHEILTSLGGTWQDFFILVSGECVATRNEGGHETEVMRYTPGLVFGEKALLQSAPRGATITAVGAVRAWMVLAAAPLPFLPPRARMDCMRRCCPPLPTIPC